MLSAALVLFGFAVPWILALIGVCSLIGVFKPSPSDLPPDREMNSPTNVRIVNDEKALPRAAPPDAAQKPYVFGREWA